MQIDFLDEVVVITPWYYPSRMVRMACLCLSNRQEWKIVKAKDALRSDGLAFKKMLTEINTKKKEIDFKLEECKGKNKAATDLVHISVRNHQEAFFERALQCGGDGLISEDDIDDWMSNATDEALLRKADDYDNRCKSLYAHRKLLTHAENVIYATYVTTMNHYDMADVSSLFNKLSTNERIKIPLVSEATNRFNECINGVFGKLETMKSNSENELDKSKNVMEEVTSNQTRNKILQDILSGSRVTYDTQKESSRVTYATQQERISILA